LREVAVGLVLCIYEDRESGDDVDGFQVGSYGDFDAWRGFIATQLENGVWGSRFPTLMMHSDCDGQWSPEECVLLKQELETIRREMAERPVLPFPASWQPEVAEEFGLTPQSALDCFITVDGETLVDGIARPASEKRDMGCSG
jgi:hypothetical protein